MLVIVHSQHGLPPIEELRALFLVDKIHGTEEHEDGSMVIQFTTDDPMLRHRLELEPDNGITVLPPVFSNLALEKRHVELLARYGVEKGDLMEHALLKITKHHNNYRFHPHSLA